MESKVGQSSRPTGRRVPIGFEKEGLLRQYRVVCGTTGNLFMYSQLA